MNVWDFQATIVRRLLLWSGFSVVAGAAQLLAGSFWRGVGIQAVAWGLIDAVIALAGGWLTRRRRARLSHPLAPDILTQQACNLRRLLWVNIGLDVLYVAGGILLALTLGATSSFWQGNGWGIVVQGGFLFFFDLTHALRARPEGT